MKDDELILRIVEIIKRRGYDNIKANVPGHIQPTPYVRKDGDEPFIPDVTATLRGRKDYFDLALKTETVQRCVSKWKLLSTLAQMRGGKLYLVAPYGHKAFATRLADKYHIHTEVVYLNEVKV